MNLARKLSIAIVAVVVALQVINAFQRVARDREVIRADIRRDHHTLGRVLKAIVPRVWHEDGEQRALSVVDMANQREGNISIRWVWPGVSGSQAPRIAALDSRVLAAGAATFIGPGSGGTEMLYTYVPVHLEDGRLGGLELGESLSIEYDQVRATIVRTAVQTGATVLISAIVTSLLGVWLVGRPVAQLMDKARRVGAGDLSGPLHFSQRDELADLASEMNNMCERLDAESRARQLALEQLRHADRLGTVGRLAAGVAHELGTPLNVVAIAGKRLATGKAAGEDARGFATTIVEQAQRMSAIIAQLLDFARRRPLRVTPLKLADVAAETLRLLSPLADRQEVRLRHVDHGDAPALADRAQLQQALANLVVNAIQAMPAGGEVTLETGVIEAEANAVESAARVAFVRVTDQGKGIAPENLGRIFEPFFTTKDVGQGTGLGLSVAHGIVEEHHGVIAVSSTPGAGSSFTVRLPLSEPV